jgi:hypothetical protein
MHDTVHIEEEWHMGCSPHADAPEARQHFVPRQASIRCLSPAGAASKKQDQKNKQNESEPASADHRFTEIKPATT